MALTNAVMEHPLSQVTPEEECAQFIFMAVVSWSEGEYSLPTESETATICAWYRNQSKPES